MTGRNRLNSDSNCHLLIDLGTYINSLSCSLIHVTGMATLFPQMATTMPRMDSRSSSDLHFAGGLHEFKKLIGHILPQTNISRSVLAVIDISIGERSGYSHNKDIAYCDQFIKSVYSTSPGSGSFEYYR